MTTLLVLLPALIGAASLSQAQSALDLSDPKKTCEAFLTAIKADDFGKAKQCWSISDDNRSGVLDLLVGEWIADHRLTEIIKRKFKDRSSDALRETELFQPYYTTEAINRTLDRLKEADVERRGQTAKMRIRWHADDGEPGQEVCLGPSGAAMRFKRVNGAWKTDANWEIGFRHPADYLEPETWVYHNPRQLAVKKRFIAEIENGKLRTVEQIGQAWDASRKVIEAEADATRQKTSHDATARRFFAAWKTSRRYTGAFYAGYGSLWGTYLWSRRLAEAESARYDTTQDRINASADHLDWMRDVQFEIRRRAGASRLGGTDYLITDNYVAEAEVLLARARSGRWNDTPPLKPATTRLASACALSNWYWEGIDLAHQALIAKMPEPFLRHMPYLAGAYEWGERQVEAQWDINMNHADRLAAARAYRDRILELGKVAGDLVKIEKAPPHVTADAAYYRANAELLVATIQTEKTGSKKALSEAAKRLHDAAKAAYHAERRADAQGIYEWSARWEKAALATATSRTERIAAIEAQLKRLTDLHKQTKEVHDAGRLSSYLLWATDYYLADTEIELAQAKKE